MKKLFSITLALVLVFGMMSFSVSAEVSYVDAEYSLIDVNQPYEAQLLEGDFSVADSFSTKTISVYLEYGKTYNISTALIAEPEGAACTSQVVVLSPELSGNLKADVLAEQYNYNGTDGIVYNELNFTPEVTGYYNLIIAAACKLGEVQLYGGDTKLLYGVKEYETVDISINNVEDFLEMTNKASDGEYEGKRVNAVFYSDLDLNDVEYYWPEYTILYVKGNGHVINASGILFGTAVEIIVDDLDVDFYLETETGYDLDCFGIYAGIADKAKFTNCDADGAFYLCCDYAEDTGTFIGDVCDVSFDNCTLYCDIMADYNAGYIGGYAGYCWGSFDMKNCTAEVSIDVRNDGDDYYCIGGVVGCMEDNGVIENVDVYADIIALNTEGVGGFAGSIDEVNSFKNVAVEGSVAGKLYVGGFIGDSSCCGFNDFINCYAAVDVEAETYFGGFIGYTYNSDSFENCYAAGNVTYVGEDGAYDGTGGVFLGYASYSNITLENCYANVIDGFKFYGYSEEGPIECNVDYVDFTDDTAVANLEKALNEYVAESDIDGLASWGGRNNMNGPKFADPAAEGDVNADGNVDVFDYMMVKSHYFKKYTLTDAEFDRADIVKDGVIDVFDYMAVKQMCFNR